MKGKKGVSLWNKAKRIIPGGTQLLSKRPERFLPRQWPSYFKKAKGVEVEDLDGERFLDMSLMGVGSCILGYADPDVNRAVKKVIDMGSMCTLNSPEEVELAELLLELHPWAGMVRFARSGGEAMAIAVRIARSYSGKDFVAFCGYHGWHDWYLAANLADKKNLDGQLLPGLKPLGVPRALKGTSIPFRYNNVGELEHIVKRRGVGVIVLETMREHEPENNFLERVRAIATKHKAVLIFDEITTGWRASFGGVFQLYNVMPDIVVYAKAIGNGFPMAAIVGRKEVMDAAQDSFISSTSWTERVGPAAALATIKKLRKENIPSHLRKIGKMVKEGWRQSAQKHNLTLAIMGIDPLPTFTFNHGGESKALHTLFTQEMLKRGFLASKMLYLSHAHKLSHIKQYLKSVDDIFSFIRKAIDEHRVKALLHGPLASDDFKRLT